MSKRVALITGAGRGIGRAVAIELAKLGYALVLVSRTESELRETAKLAPGASVFPCDIAMAKAANDAVLNSLQKFGRLDAVIHCAGVAPVLKIDETTDAQWHEVIDTNLSAAFYLASAAWPTFLKQKAGVIVNISSIAARSVCRLHRVRRGQGGHEFAGPVACAEGQAHGIRVHTVAPGATETQMFRKLMTPEQFPTEKTLDPADVARVVVQCVTGELAPTAGEVIWVHKTV